MSIVTFGILTDLHASDTSGDDQNIGIQDGSAYRITSNWSQRLTEFSTLCNVKNVDGIFLIGDLIQKTDDNSVAQLVEVVNQIEAETTALIATVPGNHEINKNDGTTMSVAQWGASTYSELAAGRRYSTTNAILYQWPNRAAAQVCSFLNTTGDYQLLVLWGQAKGAWDAADPANYEYDATATNIDAPITGAENQLVWIANTVTSAVTKPLIVLCHEHISDRGGSATIDADILATLQSHLADIATATNKAVIVIQGHLHKVSGSVTSTQSPNLLYTKDTTTTAGVTYYSLKGSVIATRKGNMRGNTCFTLKVDLTTGESVLTPYYYKNTTRGRYFTGSLDHVMKTTYRTRYK